MSLRDEIQAKQKDAMKAGDKVLLSTLRMLYAAIRNKEIDTQQNLSDEEVQKIIASQVKQLNDAMKEFQSGGRSDLVEQNQKEVNILKEYLPEQMSDEILCKMIVETISEISAESTKDIGRVMGMVMKKAAGQADGNRVRSLVEEILTK